MKRQIFLLLALASALAPFACGPQTPKARPPRPAIQAAPDPEDAATAASLLTMAMAVQGKYAYVGVERRLVVVDVADPRQPAALGHAEAQEPSLPHGVISVAVAGKHAYVVYGNIGDKQGLVVFDVADPAAPAIVAFYDSAWGRGAQARSVAVSGKYAYLYSTAGLEVVDISSPKTPKHVGSWRSHGGPTVGRSGDHVAVAGNHAYVADWKGGLRVLDISSPAAPKEVGSFDTGGYARTVVVANQRALVLDNGLRVVDVSDPKQPREIGSAAGGVGLYFLAATERLACVYGPVFQNSNTGRVGGGVHVVDLANPAAPKEVYPGPLVKETLVIAVALQGSHAFVANRAELQIADLSNPAKPVVIGSAELLPRPVTDVAVLGDHAYLANGRGGLRVVNVADRATPREIASFLSPAPIKAVVPHDRLLLASTASGLLVLDVSDPAKPRWVSTYATDGAYPAVASAGKLACVDMGDGSQEILDLSEPTLPRKVGDYRPFPTNVSGSIQHLAASGETVFVLHGGAHLRVVDLSYLKWTWLVPYLWPAVGIASFCLALLIYRWRRFIKGALWLAALAVVAAPLALVPFVPKAPREVGHYDFSEPAKSDQPIEPGKPTKRNTGSARVVRMTPDRVLALAIKDSTVYLACAGSLRVLDASDPSRLRETGTCKLPDLGGPMQPFAHLAEPQHLNVVGNHAYVTVHWAPRLAPGLPVWQGAYGVAVVDVSDPAASKVVGRYGITRGSPRTVTVLGQSAFIALGRGGLEIADISNPAAPRLVGACEPRPVAAAEVRKAK